ncbi:VanZ family protein [Sporosarcina sp. OR05]|uniref:VanZ family protein n=1 Tax=Sporosarcina sp. OR05 TaxID=2969819 RepID=UPI00352B719B
MGLISTYAMNMLGYMIVALPLYVLVRIILLKRRKKRVNKLREFLLATFILYCIGLASQTIIPKWSIGVDSLTGELYFDIMVANELASVNVTPFQTMLLYLHSNSNTDNWGSLSIMNLLGNMFMFSPIGLFIPILWRKFASLWKIAWVGLGVTFFIEGVQFFIGRSSDIDDIILNAIGVMFGYFVFKVMKKIVRR